jgi:hypothetical protein
VAADPFAASAQADRDAEAFLAGGGGISTKWVKVGDDNQGTVVGWSMSQQTDPKDNSLKTWGDGRPRMQLLLEMQEEATGFYWKWDSDNEEHVREELPDDDGMRIWYVKGGLHIAIKKAMQVSKGKLEKGALVRAKRLPNAKAKPGMKAAHVFAALWTPAAQNPNAGAASSFLTGGDDNPFGAADGILKADASPFDIPAQANGGHSPFGASEKTPF